MDCKIYWIFFAPHHAPLSDSLTDPQCNRNGYKILHISDDSLIYLLMDDELTCLGCNKAFSTQKRLSSHKAQCPKPCTSKTRVSKLQQHLNKKRRIQDKQIHDDTQIMTDEPTDINIRDDTPVHNMQVSLWHCVFRSYWHEYSRLMTTTSLDHLVHHSVILPPCQNHSLPALLLLYAVTITLALGGYQCLHSLFPW